MNLGLHHLQLTRRRFLEAAAGGMAGALGLGLYAYEVEPHWVEIVQRSMPIRNLPQSLVGKTLLQLSDLHVGPRVDDQYLISALERVRQLSPDILVITGDFVTYRGRETLRQLATVLDHFPQGKLGTLAALGNHDYGRKWSQIDVADELTLRLQDRGIVVLRDQFRDVEGLRFFGLEDFWSPRFSPARALAALDRQMPSVALCHNPDGVDDPVWEKFQGWILAGHTHGGQCRPPFLPPPILPVRNKRYTAGEFELAEGRRLYINRGLGHLLQVRFNVRPEITVFTLASS